MKVNVRSCQIRCSQMQSDANISLIMISPDTKCTVRLPKIPFLHLTLLYSAMLGVPEYSGHGVPIRKYRAIEADEMGPYQLVHKYTGIRTIHASAPFYLS